MVRGRVVGVVVDAEDERDVGIRRRRRDHHLLRARVEVLLRPFAVGEEPGRLEHDVDAELAPRKRGRVALGQHLDLDVAGADRAVADLDLLAERPERRVVVQQMRHGLRVAEVVRRDDLEVAAALQMRTEEVAADPAESVDAHPNLRHGLPPFSPVWPRV